MKRFVLKFVQALGLGLLCLLPLACGDSDKSKPLEKPPRNEQLLEQIKARGVLRVITRNAPTTYYMGIHGPQGMEYELASAFAEHLGVELELVVRDSIGEVLTALADGEGDIAAAGLTKTPQRAEWYLFGPVYQQVTQQVVCRRDGPRPDDFESLAKVRLHTIAHSSYVERLKVLVGTHPDLKWRAWENRTTEELLQAVSEGELPCVLADSNIVRINRRYFPNLVVTMSLGDPQPLAWVLPPGADHLKWALDSWLGKYRAEGHLERLLTRYYGHIELFDYVDIRAFHRRMEGRLPKYLRVFREAAEAHDIPWTLLAAQSYQESHWNPRAQSPTGVRGIMMLTLVTARAMGVESRLDPTQSIRGGAKYLAELIERVPDDVHDDDRLWFALAAYNVGMGHMWDARTLARRLGKDPGKWSDLKKVLPLLAKKQYYKDLNYGYARGWEPVAYVERVRDYQDILEQRFSERGVDDSAYPRFVF